MALRFQNRTEAGRKLSSRLLHLTHEYESPVIVALPRGGVPVAFEVAKALAAPMDLVMVRKIGAPWQPELAVAAVVDGDDPQIVENPDVMQMLRLTEDFIKKEAEGQLQEIERRRRFYLGERQRVDIKGRTVIVVDDDIATGATTRAALKAVRKAGAEHIVLAVPVAPPETIEALRAETDEIVCLSTPSLFGGLSVFYEDFHQVSDDEVVDLLNRAAKFVAEEPKAEKS